MSFSIFKELKIQKRFSGKFLKFPGHISSLCTLNIIIVLVCCYLDTKEVPHCYTKCYCKFVIQFYALNHMSVLYIHMWEQESIGNDYSHLRWLSTDVYMRCFERTPQYIWYCLLSSASVILVNLNMILVVLTDDQLMILYILRMVIFIIVFWASYCIIYVGIRGGSKHFWKGGSRAFLTKFRPSGRRIGLCILSLHNLTNLCSERGKWVSP